MTKGGKGDMTQVYPEDKEFEKSEQGLGVSLGDKVRKTDSDEEIGNRTDRGRIPSKESRLRSLCLSRGTGRTDFIRTVSESVVG